MNADGTICATCHALHHQPTATCANCHRTDVKAKHDVAFAHLQCSQCHGAVVAGFAKSNLLDWEIPRVAEEIKIVAARISAAFENLAMYGIRADRIFTQHGHVVESANVPS